MEAWIPIALASGLFSNTSNYLHRFLLKDDNDPALYTWFLEVVRLFAAVVGIMFSLHVEWNAKTWMLLASLGLVEAVSIYVYMKQHAFTALSISTIISRTRLIWTALLAYVFLGESLSIAAYAGIFIIFAGLSLGTAPHRITTDKGMRYAYLSAMLISMSNVLFKATMPYASIPIIVAAMAIPTVVGYPVVLRDASRFRSFMSSNLPSKILAAGSNVAALFFLLWALQTGPVGPVNAIYQGTMIVTVLAGIFLLREREDVARKLVGTAVAFIGILLLVGFD